MAATRIVLRSSRRRCGICKDVVIEKPNGKNKFGILEGCYHSFCLECIYDWRKTNRSCPECNTYSDFVCPSSFWVNSKNEKDVLNYDYKVKLLHEKFEIIKSEVAMCMNVLPPAKRRRHLALHEKLQNGEPDYDDWAQRMKIWEVPGRPGLKFVIEKDKDYNNCTIFFT